ncbi:hypothetical protein V1264_017348 [Littorina saxatilis]
MSEEWRQDVLKWYADLHERAYFVPPVHMKRINYDVEHIAQQQVAVPRAAVEKTPKGTFEVNESDELEDHEQQRILHCLKKFCERGSAFAPGDNAEKVMFVLSQLQFTSYLAEPCFASAAKKLRRPQDLKKENKERGDFDILIIHRRYGLMAAEIKSVGTRFTGKPASQQSDDKTLVKRLKRIINQLDKSEDVLKHVTEDMQNKPRVTKTLMLPNITTSQLQRVLKNNSAIKQELCACFGIADTEDPVCLCLTSDQLSDRNSFWEVTDDVITGMDQWWKALMTSRGEDPAMTKDVYEELVARFAGPATTVEVFCPSAVSKASKVVRTEGEGVSETAARYMDFVLHQGQVQILNSGERLVYLTGPPGAGKTVMLILQAEKWLRDGHDVCVVSMSNESMAASLWMYHSLQTKCPSLKHKLHFHAELVEGKGKDDLVNNLASRAKDDHLYVIVDEVDSSEFTEFCDELVKRVENLHLWAARVGHDKIPDYFKEFSLCVPLRSPAAVIREILTSEIIHKYQQVREYQQNVFPHTDGPLLRELRHEGLGHSDDVMPRDCEACGTQLASVLKKELGVGEANQQTSASDCPDPLQYRDVFLLSLSGFTEGKPGIITGLRQAGVPVTLLDFQATLTANERVTSVATMKDDCVVATDSRYITGLERKIVAWIQPSESDSLSVHFDRLVAFSRTSGQLITITTPRPPEQAMAQNARTMLEEIQGCTSYEEKEEKILQRAGSHITEEVTRAVDSVLQVYVLQNMGEEEEEIRHSIFFDLRQGFGTVERGERIVTARFAGIFTIRADDLPIILSPDVMQVMMLFTQGRIQAEVNNSAALLKFHEFAKKAFGL